MPQQQSPFLEGKLITEADIVLEFRDMVASHLRELGVGFVKDGEKGENLPLSKAYHSG